MTKWVTKKLGDLIIDSYAGGTPNRSRNDYYGGEIPWVSSGEVNNPEITSTIENITLAGLTNSSAKWIPANSILVALYGATAGQVSMLRIKATSNQAVLAIIPNNEIIDTDFLYNQIKFNKQALLFLAQGSGQPNLSKNIVDRLDITYPESLTEQRRIAGILSSADGAIAASEALIEKYRNIKRGLLATLLQPKEGWKKVKLGECLKQKPDYGINAPAVAYDNKLPTYLRITDITEDGYYSKNDVVSVADPDAYKYKMEEGDLVFARTGASVGKTYLYNPQDGILVFAGFLIRVKTDEDILLSSFFKYQTQTQQYKNWIANNSMRTGQPGINGNEYETFSFYLPYKNGQPDLAEQRRIAEILSSVDAKIAAEEKVVEKYKGVKKGLMEELLKN